MYKAAWLTLGPDGMRIEHDDPVLAPGQRVTVSYFGQRYNEHCLVKGTVLRRSTASFYKVQLDDGFINEWPIGAIRSCTIPDSAKPLSFGALAAPERPSE